MKFIAIITIVFILILTILTIVPATSLTIRPQLMLNLNVIKRRSVPCMSLGDMKINILSVVVPMLVLSSSTVSPSFAESAASNDIASITRLDKTKQSTVSKQASVRSSGNLSDRVEKNENKIIEILDDIKYLRQDVNEVKSDIRGIVVLGFVASALLLIRSEVKDNKMKEEMDENKKEIKEEMDKNKKEMKEEMDENKAVTDRNFIITTGISSGALIVSLVMTLATKK